MTANGPDARHRTQPHPDAGGTSGRHVGDRLRGAARLLLRQIHARHAGAAPRDAGIRPARSDRRVGARGGSRGLARLEPLPGLLRSAHTARATREAHRANRAQRDSFAAARAAGQRGHRRGDGRLGGLQRGRHAARRAGRRPLAADRARRPRQTLDLDPTGDGRRPGPALARCDRRRDDRSRAGADGVHPPCPRDLAADDDDAGVAAVAADRTKRRDARPFGAGRRAARPLPTERLPREFASVVTALNAMLESLQRSLQQQKAFTSNVAHELRTPLATLLLEASDVPPSAAIERMKADLDSLGSLVNELLRFAQAEDAMAQSREEVDIADASRTICEELAPAAVTRNLTLAFNAPPEPVRVRGNRALIDIAIRNVVDNAMKASAPGQEVEVAVDRWCDVVVEDRGPGVPDTHKARIFERFFRADRSRGGTGVGLPLVRRIAQLHGGDVRVEDRPGGGARFVLSFAPHT